MDNDEHVQQAGGAANEAAAGGASSTQQRCIKVSLAGLCRKTAEGQAVLAWLREAAPRMSALVTETWHLIHLDLRERYERALRSAWRVRDEAKWDKARVLAFMRTVAREAEDGRDPVLLDVRRRLYDPLRAEAGLDLVSRAGLPGDALQEAANHTAGVGRV
jgi:hypothetical protein